jgi:hypothetical protein
VQRHCVHVALSSQNLQEASFVDKQYLHHLGTLESDDDYTLDKVFPPGCEREALREINAYRINELKIKDGLYVPFLSGLIQGEDGTSCLGLLLSYIDCNNMTLEGIVCDNAPRPLRQ